MQLKTKQRLDYYLGATLLALLKPITMALGYLLGRDHARDVRGPVVVLKLQGGGSLIIAAPALHAIRARYPDERFLLITTPSVRPFGETLHLFDTIHTLDDRSLFSLLVSVVRVLWTIRGVDTVIDLEVYSRLTGVLSLFTLARNRFGFYLEHTFWRRGIYTHLVFFNRHANVPFFYARIAVLLGTRPLSRTETAQRMALTPIPLMEARRQRIAIGAGCSDLAVERRMSATGWVHFLRPVISASPDVELIWLGGAQDAPVVREIIEVLERDTGYRGSVDACGELPLRDSLLTLRSASRYMGIDSSLLHYARLIGLPCESFWGPVSPGQLLQPWSDVQDVTHYHPLPCSPCVHVAETPPCRGANACMRCLHDDAFREGIDEWIDGHPPWSSVS